MPPSARKQDEVRARRAEVLRLRAEGVPYEEIAEQVGLPGYAAAVTDASRALRDRKVILDKQAELFVALECERLDGLERKYQRALARADAAEDHKSLAQVGRALVALWERRARLLGLDSVRQRSEPVRTDDSLDEVARKRTERRRRFAAG